MKFFGPQFWKVVAGVLTPTKPNVPVNIPGAVVMNNTALATPMISKGPAIVNSGFSGTVSTTGSSTTVVFSSEADAILAGYRATNPILGTTLITAVGAQAAATRYIMSWTNSTTCVVDSAVTLAAGTGIASVQWPIAFGVSGTGILQWAMLANGIFQLGDLLTSAILKIGGTFNSYLRIYSGAGGDFYINGGGTSITMYNGKLGIAETSPASELSVKGGVAVGESTDYSRAAAPTGGMIIKGNVGKGTITPAGKDHTVISSIAPVIVGGDRVENITAASTTATAATLTKAGENFLTTCSVGDLAIVTSSTTVADKGIYRVISVDLDTQLTVLKIGETSWTGFAGTNSDVAFVVAADPDLVVTPSATWTTGQVHRTGTPIYADNAAALAGGLVEGDEYRTATGIKMEVYTP